MKGCFLLVVVDKVPRLIFTDKIPRLLRAASESDRILISHFLLPNCAREAPGFSNHH